MTSLGTWNVQCLLSYCAFLLTHSDRTGLHSTHSALGSCKLLATHALCPLHSSPQLSASSAADSVVAPTSLPSSPYPSELRNLVFGADQFSLCFLAKLPVSGNLEFRTLPDFLGLQAT